MGKFDYDENNNLVLENWQIARNNYWENWFRIFYEYNSHNNLIHLFGEEWENNQWIPENEPLKVTNPDGIFFGYLAKEIFLYYSKPTNVGSEKNIDDGFNLLQNYPNPFNPSTTINYQLKEGGFVTIKLYDILGAEVKTLINEEKTKGRYIFNFNASDLPNGVYVYQIRVNDFISSRKMILIK